MHRYTTPTIPITIDEIEFNNVDLFRIAIKRGSAYMLFEVDGDSEIVDKVNKTINLSLTQEETATFKEGYLEIQVRILYTNGSVQATEKAKLRVDDVFDEVII